MELPQLLWVLSLPPSVCSSGLAEDFLQDYIQVNVGSLDLCANHNITQIVEICEDYEKDYKWVEKGGEQGALFCACDRGLAEEAPEHDVSL